MKTFVFLCLLFVTVCSAQRFPNDILNQAMNAIKNAKSSVDSVMLDLKHSQRNIGLNGKNEISNLYVQAGQNINSILKTRLDYIKEKSQEAKESGKNAEDCFNDVTKNLKDAGQTGYNQLDNCKNIANKNLDTELQAFDNEQANGQRLKNQLDQVALGCMGSSNSVQVASCILMKVGAINQEIRQYQQRASQLNTNTERNKNAITLQQRSCNSDAISIVQNASTKAIYAAADCLKN
ncbi:uncharacterized protein LOC126865660 isoform X1 [Bombus huntii]|uniref:uncharacterized protein LOC126865660 isoform X1 n=2 Tax=Bombus huntii TaxID=85661 RepID=UPI0021A9A625|nr:uncharacterized protein LOC126865660 isoform X1 [Bombus huntii]